MFQSVKDRKKEPTDYNKVFQPPKVKGSSTGNCGRRVKGFVCCYVVGVASIVVGAYVSFHPHFGTDHFIGLYAVGNIFALCSTMFLVGPVKQLKRMCDISRVLATLTMLACLFMIPYAALWWKSFEFTLLFCALHILSFSWYSLSFSPCVRKMLKIFSLMKK